MVLDLSLIHIYKIPLLFLELFSLYLHLFLNYLFYYFHLVQNYILGKSVAEQDLPDKEKTQNIYIKEALLLIPVH